MGKKAIFFSILILSVFLINLNPIFATEFRADRNILIHETKTIKDDLLGGANRIKIGGVVEGDVIVGCRTLTHNGKITGSLNGACQYMRITGEVDGSVIAFCMDNNINGSIGRNLINFGSTLHIRHDGKVRSDVTSYCDEMLIDGEVGRNLKGAAGTVIISGTIKGDVEIAAGEISLLPSSKIFGNLSYKSKEKAKIEPGAQISGEVEWTEIEPKAKKVKLFSATTILVMQILLLFAALVTGLIMLLVSKDFVRGAKNAVTRSFLKSLGLGFICMICIPIAVVILFFTVIGIPISIIATFVFLILFYLSKIFVGTALGEKILTGFKKDKEAPLGWSLIVGLIIISVLTWIPFFGWLIYLVVVFIGFGAGLLARKHLLA